MSLKGKVIVVTGGSRGIGKSIILELAKEGVNLSFNFSKSALAAEELLQEVKALGSEILSFQVDVRDFDKVKAMIERTIEKFGKIDGLINNAGINRDSTLLMMKRADWQDVIETNLGGIYNFTKAVIFGFMKQRYGKIINISSISGLVGVSGQTNYSTTKAGIIGFTKSLAKETAKYGINVNAIAPGFIQTEMFTSLSDTIKNDLIQDIPLGRIGLPEEVAKAAKFLISDVSNYITGQVIVIDGGMTI